MVVDAERSVACADDSYQATIPSRGKDNTKNQYLRSFRFTSNQGERVQEAINKNSIHQSDPTSIHAFTTKEKIMNLRPRDISKEMHESHLRYQPNTTADRVFENLLK